VIEAVGAISFPIPSGGKLNWTDAGIAVNGRLDTNLPDIFAIGDVAVLIPQETQVAMRVETWANAAAQGQYLARRLCGSDEPFRVDTWFWSDQAEDNFQIVGFPQIADEVERVIDEPDRLFCRYRRNGVLVGAAAFNEFRQIKLAKRELSHRENLCV
jgi:NADPH-dependent 2,4-dienoyl-CoA reductase/sulfur reductase-like enzyme